MFCITENSFRHLQVFRFLKISSFIFYFFVCSSPLGLHFGGFIAFECKIRADSGVVMSALIQSDHKVSMLTGDALLTSLHVAKKVNICSDKLPCATLTVVGAVDPLTSATSTNNSTNSSSSTSSVIHVWTVYDEKTGVETTMPFDVQNEAVTKLGKYMGFVVFFVFFVFFVVHIICFAQLLLIRKCYKLFVFTNFIFFFFYLCIFFLMSVVNTCQHRPEVQPTDY